MQDTTNTTQKITYDAKALRRILGEAVDATPGVLGPGGGLLGSLTETVDEINPAHGITVTIEGGKVNAQILITTEENGDMIAILRDVETRAREAIAQYTDLTPGDIHAEIVDTETPEGFAARFREG